MFRYAEAEVTPGWAAKDQEMTLGIWQGVNTSFLGDRRVCVHNLPIKCRPPTLSGIFYFFFFGKNVAPRYLSDSSQSDFQGDVSSH